MTRRRFTVDLANRMLPLVRRIVEDIVHTYARWEERVRAAERAAVSARADSSGPEAEALQCEIDALARDIDGFRAELTALGVQLVNHRRGQVDFPAELDGRPVLLCWQLGEASVQYWHEADAGFRSRQRLAPLPVG
jgi:hypothetical protein